MIDLMENKWLGPMIQKELDKGQERALAEGMAQGVAQGRTQAAIQLLLELAAERFGPLPEAVTQRLSAANGDQARIALKALLDQPPLDQWLARHFPEPSGPPALS